MLCSLLKGTDISNELTFPVPDDAYSHVLLQYQYTSTRLHDTIPQKIAISKKSHIFLSTKEDSSIFISTCHLPFSVAATQSSIHTITLILQSTITNGLCSGKYNERKTLNEVSYNQHHCTCATDANQNATCRSCKVASGVWQASHQCNIS